MNQQGFREGLLWVGIAVLLFAIVSVLLFWPASESEQRKAHQQLPLAAAPTGGEFVLSRQGESFSLDEYRGKVVLLYFGYTFCPDVCPTSLALMRQALRQLDEVQLAQVQGLFVSVDPDRDSPQHLAEYTAFFHPQIRGVSGSEAQLREAAVLYGAAWRRVESDSAMGYAVDHSSNTYVLDQRGVLVEILPHGSSAQAILDVVIPLLQAQP
ncbi:MAG: SCO family protein [Thiohalomonadaceae bacterium]